MGKYSCYKCGEDARIKVTEDAHPYYVLNLEEKTEEPICSKCIDRKVSKSKMKNHVGWIVFLECKTKKNKIPTNGITIPDNAGYGEYLPAD